MKNYKLINNWSTREELNNLENSSNFISKEEIEKIKKAIKIKKHLEDSGFYTSHYKKEKKVNKNQRDVSYVFNVEKHCYKMGDSSDTFHGAVFSIYKWLVRCGEVREYELI
tara:strand:- start:2891 stop:3223 length:333 start_codon:yes stop_codon:yes gene_type:complete